MGAGLKAISLWAAVLLLCVCTDLGAEDPKTLSIGEKAPAFSLKGIDDQIYTLENFKEAKVLVIVFSANHCPTAQAYELRMMELSSRYAAKEMQLVAISSNHPGAVCLEELGYSDLGDSFGEMRIRAQQIGFNFPYLYDGDEQSAALAYGAKATPHVFIFDQERKLQYSGRIDDMEDPYQEPTQYDTRNAIDALLSGEEVEVKTTKAFGCSMKWKSKMEWRHTLDERWKEKPVMLENADLEGIKALIHNEGDNYRLINVWATWCGPCIIEFPEFVAMQRMYGQRNFEVVSVSTDKESASEKVKAFLVKNQAAFPNYHYVGEDKDVFINAFDPDWQGNLPYTLLVAPGGKVLYRHDGIIDPLEVKQAVVKELGRYFADD
jgi:thiol-disulfide isomerase/thioredoxin